MLMMIIFLFSAFISEIMGTIAGFGSSTLFLPIAVLFVDFKTALVLVALYHFFGTAFRTFLFRRDIDWHLLGRFGVPSIVCTVIGALLAGLLPVELMKGLLGIFLITYAVISLSRRAIILSPTLTTTALGGAVSGFFAGLIGTGGALRSAFLTAIALPKKKHLATAAVLGFAVDWTRIPLYLQQGFLPREYYWYVPLLLGIALAGSLVGRIAVERIHQELFRKIILLALMVAGLWFVYQWLL